MPEDDAAGGGWFSYAPGSRNPHLTPEQLAAVERAEAEVAARRGPPVARVVIDVFASGEAVPQVQLLEAGGSGMEETAARIVEQAAASLATWR